MPSLIPFVWCQNTPKHNAESMAKHYLSIFVWSRLLSFDSMVTQIEIFGCALWLLNGDDQLSPNPSISLSLRIKDKKLTKKIRDALSCWWEVLMEYEAYDWSPGYGRCNDCFGVSWQVMYDDREETTNHTMIPSFMFTHENAWRAQEAMKLYCDIFPDSGIQDLRRYEAGGENVEWTINHGEFTLAGQQFIAMDSAMDHGFIFDDGVSLMVITDGQQETDSYRNALVAEWGIERECGWCCDKFGVSRQIIPIQLTQLMSDHDRADEVIENLMSMKKIVIADL